MLRFERLSKIYLRGQEEVHAVSDISLEIKAGELIAILGPSGSGYFWLMNRPATWTARQPTKSYGFSMRLILQVPQSSL